MPGLNPGEMNGHDFSRFGPDRGHNFDPYNRDDPYRDDMRADDDPYRRLLARNGGGRPANDRFNSDHLADQSSLSDFNSTEPAFELDHLATFAAGGARKGTMHVEDGLRKLRQMENTTGIWTMRCILLVERRFIVILDKNSGEELERFPVHYIQEPTAIFKNDRREIYNNLILFTVMDESNKKDAQADMHIFQSVRTPAQNIVDEIFAAKRGHGRVSSGGGTELSEILLKHKNGQVEQEGLNLKGQIEHDINTSAFKSFGPNQNDFQTQAIVHQSAVSPASNHPTQDPHSVKSTLYQTRTTALNKEIHTLTQQRTATANQAEADVDIVGMTANEQREVMRSLDHFAADARPGYKIPPPPTGPAPEPPGSRDPYDFGGFRESIEHRQFNASQYGASQFNNEQGFIGGGQRTSIMTRPSYLPYKEREDEIGSNELLERDVQLLNHCFDDIEKFVARLQQAAEAYKELERRKKERGGKGKKNASGDGMLGHRARPPPAQDFVDIFQKFKLSFNLLAKLKAHIHDPNAPELVHFLFTPLSLIYEASRDPIHGSMNLGDQAAAPVLTQDAKQLLLNCLTSKEIELWQALGKNWTTSKDEWKGYIPPYVPRFYDGWQPAPTVVDEPPSRANLESAVVAHHEQIRNRVHEQDVRDYVHGRVMPFPPEEERFARDRGQDFEPFDRDPRAPSPPRNIMNNTSVIGYQQYVEQHIDRNYRANQQRVPEPARQPSPPIAHPVALSQPLDDNAAYLEELKRTGATVYEVLHERQGKNSKELTVNKGDYLQVLDSSRNWWKVRNYKGQTGYCPYTILKQVTTSADNGRVAGGAGNTSTEQSAALSSDKKPSKRDFRSEHMPSQFAGNLGASGQFDEPLDVSFSSQMAEIDPLTLAEEVQDRHVFRPVEPAYYANKGVKGFRQTQPQIDLHNELRSKMGYGPSQHYAEDRLGSQHEVHQPRPTRSAGSPSFGNSGHQSFYITPSSSQTEVSSWLLSKGFTTLCRQSLKGFTGRDLFSLQRHEIEQLIGHEEAARLAGQLTLQKKMTGYKTQSAAELNAIFQKRRARSDQQGEALGQPPDFRPSTPSSYDGPPDSDSDEDDRQLAETGKTLRDLLIRQRQKIIGTSIFDNQH